MRKCLGLARAYVVNEAHGLRKDAVRQLPVLLERLPQHVVVIVTATNEGEDVKGAACKLEATE